MGNSVADPGLADRGIGFYCGGVNTRIIPRRRFAILFAMVAIGGPLSGIVIDLLTNLVDPAVLPRYFTPLFAVTTLGSSVLGVVLIVLMLRSIRKRGPEGWGLRAWTPVILTWGVAHNIMAAWVERAASGILADAEAMLLVLAYSFAVGLYFSLLLVFGTIADLEDGARLHAEDEETCRALGMRTKFLMSISLTVVAFLFGSGAVALYGAKAGLSVSAAYFRFSLIGIPFLVLTFLMVSFLRQIFADPVVAAAPRVDSLSDRDLTQTLEARGADELAALLRRINRFAARVADAIAAARDGAEQTEAFGATMDEQTDAQRKLSERHADEIRGILELMTTLNTRVEETASASEQINRTLEALSGRIEQQQRAVNETAAAAEEMAASMRSMDETTAQRNEAARSLSARTKESADTLSSAGESLREVSGRVDKLRDLNTMISSVAAKTNLLAMNAAIEAAHAGGAGQGFAVVAGEIRNLAETAGDSAKGTSAFLKDIISHIQKTEESMATVESSFASIRSEEQQVMAAFAELSNAARENRTAAEQVGSNMNALQASNTEVTGATAEISSGVESINRSMQEIRESSRNSSVVLQALNAGTVDLRESAAEVERASRGLRESAGELRGLLSSFRLPEQTVGVVTMG